MEMYKDGKVATLHNGQFFWPLCNKTETSSKKYLRAPIVVKMSAIQIAKIAEKVRLLLRIMMHFSASFHIVIKALKTLKAAKKAYLCTVGHFVKIWLIFRAISGSLKKVIKVKKWF